MPEYVPSIEFPDGPCTEVCLYFLRFKQSLGQKFEGSYVYCLRDICQQMNQAKGDTPGLSKDMALRIAERRTGEAQGTQLKRIRVLRQLAEYMVSMDIQAYIIPKHFTQQYRYDFTPFIFSREQIAEILHCADQMEYRPRSPYMHLVMPAILRVFFGCGLRSAEARQLKHSDVDLASGVLTVDKSKNMVSRYVPMSASLATYLRNYVNSMASFFQRHDHDVLLFPAPSGGVIHDTTLRDAFRALILRAGSLAATGAFPRLHDMRHTFIVHSYAQMTGELGFDTYTAMPIIATYVGHTNIKDTERYIHLPAFDHANITDAGEPFVESCVPKVMFDA